MTHFITIHPIVSLLILVFASALIALFIGGILHSAGMRMPKQSDIEPEDLIERCAWCDRENAIKSQPNYSHGICTRHAAQLLANAKRLNQHS